LEYLSNIELYYTAEKDNGRLILSGEEKNHAVRVMRHTEGEVLYITDGKGKIYKTGIISINRDFLTAEISEEFEYSDNNHNLTLCIPKLKNPERFEFALEKCTELGITSFIVFNSARGVKKSDKKERWEKIVLAAMKQSLRSYIPVINYIPHLSILNTFQGKKIILEQNSPDLLKKGLINSNEKYIFIFGPEGGLDEKEISDLEGYETFKISPNRLRTETAIIKTASVLTD
jgi:16S rRNA (uracil1498-N3)-methyltransferase